MAKDYLKQKHPGLGRKPANTKRVRSGWCQFCKEVHPAVRTRGIGYLCPTCGGLMVGTAPDIDRKFIRTSMR